MLSWERVKSDRCDSNTPGMRALWNWNFYRAKVPGGWLIMSARVSALPFLPKTHGMSLTFYPDPDHSWDP